MNRTPLILIALMLAVTACHQSPTDEKGAAAEVNPTVAVQTMKLAKRTIGSTVNAFGTVVAKSSELMSISVQYESKVTSLLVSAGEPVKEGQALIEIEPSPDTKLHLAEAKSAAESAQLQLAQTQKRFEMKLAINQELQLAKQTARDTAATLASLTDRGAAQTITLRAHLSGLVSSIDVRIGQIVPAGSPLLSIVPSRHIEILLGVEPGNAERLRVGQKVRVFSVNQHSVEGDGVIRLITRRVNPQTRLVDTFVTIPSDVPLLLDGYVRGEIKISEKNVFVVPRDAILPSSDGLILFTVRDDHAVANKVTTGFETDVLTEVSGKTLHAGDEVVTEGNYQLVDGIAITRSK
jgi:membrane fusion protein (multidrug efflux system)